MIDLAGLQTVLNQIFAPGIADNLNQKATLLRQVRKTIGGGKNIAFDVKVGRGTSAGSYASGANITGDDHDTEIPAVLQWKRNKAEFKVAGDALAAAASGGPQAYANLFRKSIMDSAKNLSKEIARQMYADGTGNTGLDIDGLGAIVAATGSYAGIDRGTTYPIWRANVLANGGTPRALDVALLRQLERTIFTVSGFSPDFIITTPIIYEKYAALFDSIKRVMTDSQDFDLGTSQLSFQGIPIIRDAQCPVGHMYMLTQDSMEFQQLPAVQTMDGPDGTETLEDGDGSNGLQVHIEMLGKSGDSYKGFVKLYGNMVCEHPNVNGVIKDISEA